MNRTLEGKIALITGSSKGIGAAVAKRYAQEGAHIILVGRNVEQLEKVDDAVQAAGSTATIVPMDLTQLELIDQLAQTIAQKFGKLDIVVGNAGTLGDLRPLTSITNNIWDECFTLNVTANHRIIRAFDPLMQHSKAGRWIFVTSGSAEHLSPYWGVYSSSKRALDGLVKTYAKEIEHSAMRANLVSPGMVDTDMLAQAFPGRDNSFCPTPDKITDVFVQLAQEDCTLSGEIVRAQ